MKKLIKTLVLLVVFAVIGTAAFLFVKDRFLKAEPPAASAASERFIDAEDFYQQNPLQYDEAIEYFQAVILEAPGSDEAAKAENRIQTIRAQKEQAVDEAWQILKIQANELAEANNHQAAYDLLTGYEGTFAPELLKRRNTMKQKLLQTINIRREQEEEQKQAAEEALTALVEKTVTLLRDSRFEEVNNLLEEAQSNPKYDLIPDQLALFITEASDVTALPERICLNLKSPTNGTSEIYLKSGKERLRIKAVNGLQVVADKIIIINGSEAGSTPANFTFSDLSLREQARRLGNSSEPEYDIMRALMLLQGGKEQSAIKYLEKADTPLAQMIADSISAQQQQEEDRQVPVDFEPVFEPNADNILIIL